MNCEPIVVQVRRQKESWLQVEEEVAQSFLFAQFVKTERLGCRAKETEVERSHSRQEAEVER